jgi:N-acyl homoserine lactone hydrolase
MTEPSRNPLPTYQVTTICVGHMRVDHSQMVSERGFGQPVEIPTWTAAIEGHGHRILVDTGISDPDWVGRVMVPCRVEPGERLDRAVEGLGWSLPSIDTVINTHLHHDHCANNRLLPHARFYIQAAEWEYAQHPIASQQVLYDNRGWEATPLSFFNYVLVGLDYFDILPGIRLIQTPGHTPGHQSVLVNTDEGTLCITGDAVNFPQSFVEHRPGGIAVSATQALASIEKIRRLADRVLMTHDTTNIRQHQRAGFPRVSEWGTPGDAWPPAQR